MFNNVLLDRFSITNTYFSLCQGSSPNANVSYIAIRKYIDLEPLIILGDETEIEDLFAPLITINQPQNAEQLYYTPVYDISIEEMNLDEVWYTIDEGIHNYTITDLVGTIDQGAWSLAPSGPVTIRFYARDLAGNIGTSFVIVIKTSEQQQPPPAIPGYEIYLLSGTLGISILLLIKRRKPFK